MLPAEQDLAAKARLAITTSMQAQALQGIATVTQQAYRAGPGSRFTLHTAFAANGTIEYHRWSGELELKFRGIDKDWMVNATSAPLEGVNEWRVDATKGYLVIAQGTGEGVRLEIKTQEAR